MDGQWLLSFFVTDGTIWSMFILYFAEWQVAKKEMSRDILKV